MSGVAESVDWTGRRFLLVLDESASKEQVAGDALGTRPRLPRHPGGSNGLERATCATRRDATLRPGAPARTRTCDRQFRKPSAPPQNIGENAISSGSASRSASTDPQDADLAEVARAWASLPEPLCAAILAL